MPKTEVDGMEAFSGLLTELTSNSTGLIKRGLYEANKPLYAEVKRGLDALPTGKKELDEVQKEGLLKSLYGSEFQEKDGEIYFVISVTGYNDKKTKSYPKGQPNIMLLRSLERGTSYLHKHPVMRKSLNAAKGRAIEAMQKTISKDIANMQKG